MIRDNYTVIVSDQNNLAVSILSNVGVNTMYVALPFIIEDQCVRHGAWLEDETEEDVRKRVRAWFSSHCRWFDTLGDEGSADYFGFTVVSLS
jgi:hypothetical protein